VLARPPTQSLVRVGSDAGQIDGSGWIREHGCLRGESAGSTQLPRGRDEQKDNPESVKSETEPTGFSLTQHSAAPTITPVPSRSGPGVLPEWLGLRCFPYQLVIHIASPACVATGWVRTSAATPKHSSRPRFLLDRVRFHLDNLHLFRHIVGPGCSDSRLGSRCFITSFDIAQTQDYSCAANLPGTRLCPAPQRTHSP